jgi:hypothetical protein
MDVMPMSEFATPFLRGPLGASLILMALLCAMPAIVGA